MIDIKNTTSLALASLILISENETSNTIKNINLDLEIKSYLPCTENSISYSFTSFWPFLINNFGLVLSLIEFFERNGFIVNESLNSVSNVSISSSFCLFFS